MGGPRRHPIQGADRNLGAARRDQPDHRRERWPTRGPETPRTRPEPVFVLPDIPRGYVDDRPESERSPSPEPTYDETGKRTNSRQDRYRKKIEDERNELINKQMQLNPLFKGMPAFNKKPSKKVFIPVKEYPDTNFIGLIGWEAT